MIGSMIVGFLIGLIASAISNRGERMGCIGKTFVGWLGAFVGQLLFWKLGTDASRYCYRSFGTRCCYLISPFWNRNS